MDDGFWVRPPPDFNIGARRLGRITEVGRHFIWVEGTCGRQYQLDAGCWPTGDAPEVGMQISFVPHWRRGQLYAIDPLPMVRA